VPYAEQRGSTAAAFIAAAVGRLFPASGAEFKGSRRFRSVVARSAPSN